MILGQSNITRVDYTTEDDNGTTINWTEEFVYKYNEHDYPVERKAFNRDVYVMTDVFNYECIK